MPNLLLFAACEKAIISVEGPLSLITVLEKITLHVPTGAVLPDKAFSPMLWSTVAIWEKQEGEEGQSYEHKSRLVNPSGEEVLSSEILPIDYKGKRLSRSVGQLQFFPVANGRFVMELFLRRTDEVPEADWKVVATYPIEAEITYVGEAVR